MPQATLQPSPAKESRRILGEKSANSVLSPACSPVKKTLLNSQSPKKLLPSPSFTAQKRCISQVDGHDSTSRGIFHVQQRVEAPEEANEQEQTNQPLQQQPTTATRPQILSPTTESSFVSISPTVPSDPTTRKQFILEKATLLRTKLQSAMRNVQDVQIDRRVSELEEHSRKYPRLSAAGSGSSSESQIQQHLKRKFGLDGVEDNNEVILRTPQASQQIPREGQGEFDDEDDTTPTQESHALMHSQRTDRATSPINMLLSSPTYNCNPTLGGVQNGQFSDDRPRQATVDTSPSSSQREEGDGDAVDGLLKLMGRNAPVEMETEDHEDTPYAGLGV
ncbi:hypothetical protein BJY04DRAFT_181472 [Aspergillus karnatakaensis]|uniref:uncharacterized protein n=1 Tax=Aspergillus karnatakaensis TaxID=1810916 RepID=UPI003CCD32F7